MRHHAARGHRRRSCLFRAALLACIPAAYARAQAPTASYAQNDIQPFDHQPGDVTVRLGLTGLFFRPDASLTAGGAPLIGANLDVSNNVTVAAEASYFLTRHFALGLGFGLPPKTTLTGTGLLAPYGTLGKVRYGPVAGVLQYHFSGRFRPWLGAGASYVIVFHNEDGAVENLNARNQWAPVVQGGIDYALARHWSLYGSLTQLFLRAHATGMLGPVPLTASVRADPLIAQLGIAYRF